MGKMKNLDLRLKEYDEALNAFGHGDPLVRLLKRELLALGSNEVRLLVEGIDLEFDTLVFENQTEGRF